MIKLILNTLKNLSRKPISTLRRFLLRHPTVYRPVRDVLRSLSPALYGLVFRFLYSGTIPRTSNPMLGQRARRMFQVIKHALPQSQSKK